MQKIIPEDAVLVPDAAERVFEGFIYDVYQWQQKLYDGSSATFEMLRRTDTVQVLALKDDKLVTQYEEQPHHGARFGAPGGRVDPEDESWLAAVQRECAEETGLFFKNWRLVNVKQPFSKMEWFIATFLAWEVEKEEAPSHDAGEKIEQKLLAILEAREAFGSSSHLGDLFALLEDAETSNDLLALPEFKGKVVNR